MNTARIIHVVLCVGFLVCGSRPSLLGQSDIGNINLVVVVPESSDVLGETELGKLETRIARMVTKNGVGASGQSDFLIYPEFEIFSEEVLDGLNPLTVIEGELSLFVKQMSSSKLFGSCTVSVRGMGNTPDKARSNCIRELSTSDRSITEMLSEAKEKIVAYYEANCDLILEKALAQSNMEQYAESIGTLLQIPEACSECYSLATERVLAAYRLHEEQQCGYALARLKVDLERGDFGSAMSKAESLNPSTECYEDYEKVVAQYKDDMCSYYLMNAQATVASGDYSGALSFLRNIDPQSSCYQESEDVIASINEGISDAEREEYTRQRVRERDALELRRAELKSAEYAIDAAREIAIARYENQPKEVYRNYLWVY